MSLRSSSSIFLLILFLCFVSCGKKSITLGEISFQGSKVCYEGKPFTGTIWTEDKEFGCFETKDGDLQCCTFYHENGKVAIKMEIPSAQEQDTSHGDKHAAPVTQVFDDKGNTMDLMSFQRQYLPLWIKIAMVQGELINK